jgi:hypothetical protein
MKLRREKKVAVAKLFDAVMQRFDRKAGLFSSSGFSGTFLALVPHK